MKEVIKHLAGMIALRRLGKEMKDLNSEEKSSMMKTSQELVEDICKGDFIITRPEKDKREGLRPELVLDFIKEFNERVTKPNTLNRMLREAYPADVLAVQLCKRFKK